MPNVDDSIAHSSVGKGLWDQAFGRALRDVRLSFRLDASYVCKHSNISLSRLMEIEGGVPPAPGGAELESIAFAMDIPLSRVLGLRT